jgi:hypothetical protein
MLLLRAFVNLVNPRLHRYSKPALLAALIFVPTLAIFVIVNVLMNSCSYDTDVQHVQHQASWTGGHQEFLERVYSGDSWDSQSSLLRAVTRKRTHVCISAEPYELKAFPHPEYCSGIDEPCARQLIRPEPCIMDTDRFINNEHPESAAHMFYVGGWSIDPGMGPPAPPSFWGYCGSSTSMAEEMLDHVRSRVLADRNLTTLPSDWTFGMFPGDSHHRINCGQRGGHTYDAVISANEAGWGSMRDNAAVEHYLDRKACDPGADNPNCMPCTEGDTICRGGWEFASMDYIETVVVVQYQITRQRMMCPAASQVFGAALGYWAAIEVLFTILFVILLGSAGVITENGIKLGIRTLTNSAKDVAEEPTVTPADIEKLRAEIMAELKKSAGAQEQMQV